MINVRRGESRAGMPFSFGKYIVLGLLMLSTIGAVHAQTPTLSFAKSFNPAAIGPGSVSTLQFTITNSDSVGVRSLAFTDNLPTNVIIATPANITSSCGGIVSAPDGGSTITFNDGSVQANQSCTVSVNVTSSTIGMHQNVSGDLVSDLGNSGNAIADLTVDAALPGFSKSFSPSSINLGERSTLTFTIDNTANNSAVTNLRFMDNLPTGMVVADPANASTDCVNGLLSSATPGSSTIVFAPQLVGSNDTLPAGASCSASVDVEANAAGLLGNISDELSSGGFFGAEVSSGKASAVLAVSVSNLNLTKSFIDDPTAPGGTVTLEFTVSNLNRAETATNVSFTDDLDATLAGLFAISLPNEPCGIGSALTGTSVLSLSGGSLGPGESCTFSATLQVPVTALPGSYPNTTAPVTADIAGRPFTGNAATDILFINTPPVLTKGFLSGNPVGGGDTITMEFTIENSSTTSAATDISFTDSISDFINGATVSSLPADGFCGAGATLATIVLLDAVNIVLSNASLPAGGTCSFTVDILIPVDAVGGTFTNTTSDITATVDDATQIGNPASASLTVVEAPEFAKDFIDDPVQPGNTVTLEFTISHSPTALGDATDIAFTDNLGAVLTGLVATGLPVTDVCGVGSQLSGTSVLTFTGGSLAPGETCTVPVTLSVPAEAVTGNYNNTTSIISALSAGVPTTGGAAQAVLQVAGLTVSKEFTDDPVIPGDTANLRFTITNTGASLEATAISFSDNLNGVIPGLTATGLPLTDICGTGSQLALSGNILIFTGGNLLAGASCQFDVTLQVPENTPSDTYANITSSIQATIGGNVVTINPVRDDLIVTADQLLIAKMFAEDAVLPGDTIDLTFTVTNLNQSLNNATDISFTDNLDTALSGLVATGLPLSDVCGTGSSLSGTGVIELTSGTLAPGASCTFSVTLQVPPQAEIGNVVNATGDVTGLIGGLPVRGDPASDDFRVRGINFTKAFAAPVDPGASTTLSFTIENLDSVGIARLSFSDDLEAVLPGLIAGGLPLNDICGVGSVITGTSVLTLTGGNLPANGFCTFDVDITTPATAVAGSYLNITSDLVAEGTTVSPPAMDTLVVNEFVFKVKVCHRPGTPAEQTLLIPLQALLGHLRHGDFIGPCPGDYAHHDGDNGDNDNGGGDNGGNDKKPGPGHHNDSNNKGLWQMHTR